MATIIENLKKILEARYGKDVRQAIHDSIENCYNDGKAGSIDLQARQDIETLETSIETVESIAKGKNQARVFSTTEAMENWLSDLSNKGVANVGDNLYIVAVDVPDWWISSVLEAPNESGMYYEIAQLETQKVDLTTIENAINSIDSKIGSTDISEIGDGTLTGGLDALNSNLASKQDHISYGGLCCNANLKLTNSHNLNDCTNINICYFWEADVTPENSPTSGCTMFSIKTVFGYVQLASRYNSSVLYIRTYSMDYKTWYEWKQL